VTPNCLSTRFFHVASSETIADKYLQVAPIFTVERPSEEVENARPGKAGK